MEKPIWGRTDVLGKSVRLNGRLYSVIGVLPPGMAFLEGPDVAFVPLSLVKLREDRGHWHSFDALARLKPGVSIAQGQAAMSVIARQHEKVYEPWLGYRRQVVAQGPAGWLARLANHPALAGIRAPWCC